MAQEYYTIDNADYLDESDPVINASLEALRTNFSGDQRPTTVAPSPGQLHYRTSDKTLWICTATDSWKIIGHYNEPYGQLGGLVSRLYADQYPMQTTLHMGGKNITNLADPGTIPGTDADYHAVPLGYAKTQLIDNHRHTSSDGSFLDSEPILFDDLSANNATAQALITVAATGAKEFTAREWDLATAKAVFTGSTSWQDLITTSEITVSASEKKGVISSVRVRTTVSACEIDLGYYVGASWTSLETATTDVLADILGTAQYRTWIVSATWTPGTTETVTFAVRIRGDTSTQIWERFLFVI